MLFRRGGVGTSSSHVEQARTSSSSSATYSDNQTDDDDNVRGFTKSKSWLALLLFGVLVVLGVFALSIAGMPHLYSSYYRGTGGLNTDAEEVTYTTSRQNNSSNQDEI